MATRPKRKDNLREEAAQGDEATSIVPVEHVQSKILVIRGQKVILDSDLAKLYGVTTGRLNEQVKRNLERFPPDFAFRLTENEFTHLKSHFATSSSGWGGRRKLPYAFTEHGKKRDRRPLIPPNSPGPPQCHNSGTSFYPPGRGQGIAREGASRFFLFS